MKCLLIVKLKTLLTEKGLTDRNNIVLFRQGILDLPEIQLYQISISWPIQKLVNYSEVTVRADDIIFYTIHINLANQYSSLNRYSATH